MRATILEPLARTSGCPAVAVHMPPIRSSVDGRAGAITRSSEDAFHLAARNLAAERATLQARINAITTRLAVPVGQKQGRARGYATQAERFEKQRRLQVLQRRLPALMAHNRVSAGHDWAVSLARDDQHIGEGGRRAG